MSSKYKMALTWNKSKSKMFFPVLPDKITVKIESKNNTVTIVELGDVIEKGVPGLYTYNFSCIFPKKRFGGVVVQKLKSPNYYVGKIERLLEKQQTVKFTVSGMKISKNCLITHFEYSEEGGDVGTIKYTITLKEYKKPKVRKLKSSSSSKTYKVKKGDTLRSIAQKKLKDVKKWTKLWELNKKTIKKAAKKKGKKATKNKPYLVPGIILRLK